MNEERGAFPDRQMSMRSDNITQVELITGSRQRPKITIANDYLQAIYRRFALVTVLIPFISSVVAMGLLWRSGIGSVEIGLLVSMYALTTFAIEVGFHRHFSHHAFQTTTAVRVIIAILGSMAAQGGVIYWVANHRRHHQYSDISGDPHSPHLHGDGIRGRLHGLWHAYLGWFLAGEVTNSMLFAKDLLRDPVIVKVNKLHQLWVILGLVIPAVLGGVLTWTWMGAFQGLMWGGLVRVFLGHQIAWLNVSISHFYGSRPFDTGDRSTNNILLAIPTWGQSWHNNHHAFPNSAIGGLEWWQIDLGAWAIRLLEFAGLVWDIKIPTSGMIKLKKAA